MNGSTPASLKFRPHFNVIDIKMCFSSVQFSRSVVSDSLRPHQSQHARPPCPSPTPGVHSDSRKRQFIYPLMYQNVYTSFLQMVGFLLISLYSFHYKVLQIFLKTISTFTIKKVTFSITKYYRGGGKWPHREESLVKFSAEPTEDRRPSAGLLSTRSLADTWLR